ncbi:bifunctional nuclease family protein [Corynebacterium sp. TAE3-ERU12]|uniref:bifunctional nuclease domain-containing protein n=1 Tax=Corynebacterium sp. TAE3-ERU12 TaxID=2849491 RepID=UPI001C49742B|nr:bifunctional nuclease domain-containing protein [Corynebacterium sp. TAE3-ERU12]MBV7295510.1 bifunctional nuclease family protein [Corynebacterium sp. TAE3-ERU12]
MESIVNPVELIVREANFVGPEADALVILHWEAGQRDVPVWIYPPSLPLIDHEAGYLRPSRPTVLNAIGDIVEVFGGCVDRVEVRGIVEGVFISDVVVIDSTGQEHPISLRISEAIALAQSLELTIIAPQDFVESVSLPTELVQRSGAGFPEEPEQEESVDEFRRFLEDIDAADFLASDGDTPQPETGDTDVTDDDNSDGSAPGK